MNPLGPHPSRPRRRGRTMVLAGVAAVAAAIALLVLLAVVSSGRSGGDGGAVESRFITEEFNAGSTARLAAEIAAGGPILLPDAGPGRSKDVYVQHMGPGDDEGWVVFDSRAAGTGRECTLRWDREEREFTDPCSGERYGPDGGELPHYETRVDDGDLHVDLRRRL